MTDNTLDFKDILKTLLEKFPESFEENELAYLTIQGKNELQIRDKIAWLLHCELSRRGCEHIVVRREYSKGKSRSKVDLAVLQLDQSDKNVEKELALIEFKAQSLLRREGWYIDEFVKDVEKMKIMCGEDNDPELFFVFLHSTQSSYKNEFRVIQAAKKYHDESHAKECKNTCDTDCITMMKTEWERFFENKVKGHYQKEDHYLTMKIQLDCPDPILLDLGLVYGIQCFTAAMLWGPAHKNDFEVE